MERAQQERPKKEQEIRGLLYPLSKSRQTMKRGDTMHSPLYTIFTLDLAGYLMRHKFGCVSVGQNYDAPGKLVYRFPNSEELQQAISEYRTEKQN